MMGGFASAYEMVEIWTLLQGGCLSVFVCRARPFLLEACRNPKTIQILASRKDATIDVAAEPSDEDFYSDFLFCHEDEFRPCSLETIRRG